MRSHFRLHQYAKGNNKAFLLGRRWSRHSDKRVKETIIIMTVGKITGVLHARTLLVCSSTVTSVVVSYSVNFIPYLGVSYNELVRGDVSVPSFSFKRTE